MCTFSLMLVPIDKEWTASVCVGGILLLLFVSVWLCELQACLLQPFRI